MTPRRYRRRASSDGKPWEGEAIQWTGDNAWEVAEFLVCNSGWGDVARNAWMIEHFGPAVGTWFRPSGINAFEVSSPESFAANFEPVEPAGAPLEEKKA